VKNSFFIDVAVEQKSLMWRMTNSKSEARNPKQYPMTQIRMTKTVRCWISVLNIGVLIF